VLSLLQRGTLHFNVCGFSALRAEKPHTNDRRLPFDGARIGIKELQGAIVSIEQAVDIARTLGVDVRLE